MALTRCWLAGLESRSRTEFDVDLEITDRERLEVGEAPEAGTEVVQRKSAPDIGEAVHKGLALLDIAHERGLGDLEYEVRWIVPLSAALSAR